MDILLGAWVIKKFTGGVAHYRSGMPLLGFVISFFCLLEFPFCMFLDCLKLVPCLLQALSPCAISPTMYHMLYLLVFAFVFLSFLFAFSLSGGWYIKFWGISGIQKSSRAVCFLLWAGKKILIFNTSCFTDLVSLCFFWRVKSRS
ncbi:hypothetical protein F5884DRAFT_32027 [Xylogone sp. PMI_703]|nr:hypothetical protein F5884DRAFT_32027 [Xylogone sp. PMI_703]